MRAEGTGAWMVGTPRGFIAAGLLAGLAVALAVGPACSRKSSRARPAVVSVAPGTGETTGNLLVLVTTKGFRSDFQVDQPLVFFGSDLAVFQSTPTRDSVEVLTPPFLGAPGYVDVTVQSGDGKQTATLTDGFLYTAPPSCSITLITPDVGPLAGGTQVQIDGTGFPPSPVVDFGGINAPTVGPVSSVQIHVITPTGASPGPVDVTVADLFSSLSCTAVGGYTYVTVPPPPPCTITSACPGVGSMSGGDSVTILGADFEDTPTVFFGTNPSPLVTFVSILEITAVTPAGATAGPADITVDNPSGSSCTLSAGFIYRSSDPPQDIYEPNETMGNCSGGSLPFSSTNLTIHSSTDEDFYCVTLGHSATLTITMTPDPGAGNFDLELYETMGGSLINGSYQLTGTDTLVESVNFGWYAVRVFGASGCGEVGRYSLDITD